MTSSINIDLTTLSQEELIELYKRYRTPIIAHNLWCRTHPDIPVNFSLAFVRLLEKFEKLVELNDDEDITTPDVMLDALIDSIYTDCRGLFCEKKSLGKNYTLQNCLNIVNEKKAVEEIDKIIDGKDFNDPIVSNYSFRDWVKFVTDRAIAHKDNLSGSERIAANYRYKFLNNSMNVFEFQYYIYQVHNIYEKIVGDFASEALRNHEASK